MMLYLSGSACPEAQELMREGTIGFIAQPDIGNVVPKGVTWAADNGCFNPRFFTVERWKAWLDRQSRTALWATVPDVILKHEATMERWEKYVGIVKELGFNAAFCAQDGCTEPPSDADCVFLGGTTEWKISADALSLIRKAQDKGMMTHMGRVNSFKRLRIAHSWGCDTVDGTFLSYAPSKNVIRLERWLERLENEAADEEIILELDACELGHPHSEYRYEKNGRKRCKECDRVRWRKKKD
jgi:hypothetical protein